MDELAVTKGFARWRLRGVVRRPLFRVTPSEIGLKDSPHVDLSTPTSWLWQGLSFLLRSSSRDGSLAVNESIELNTQMPCLVSTVTGLNASQGRTIQPLVTSSIMIAFIVALG